MGQETKRKATEKADKKMSNDRCSNCGEVARKVRENYLFKESGLSNVVLENIEVIKCEHCGNADPVINKLNELMRVLALAVVEKPWGLTGGEVRFLRKFVGMNGESFASLLHTDKSLLSKWENNHEKIGSKSDLLIRCVAFSLGPGMEEGRLRRVVRKFPEINETPKVVPVRVDLKELTYTYA